MDWFTGLEAFQQERRVVEESSKVNLKATEPCKGRLLWRDIHIQLDIVKIVIV